MKIKTGNKSKYLAMYDYGQGAVWIYIWAFSTDDILKKYPKLVVLAEKPKWFCADDEPSERMIFDIDRPTGWLKECERDLQ